MRLLDPQFLILLLVPLGLLFILFGKNEGFEKYFEPKLLKKMQQKKGGMSRKTRNILLIFSLIFAILALSRPVIDKGEIKVKSSFIDVITAFDISKSMFSDDVYPDRFEFAKRKFYSMLDYFQDGKIGVIGFSSKAFLIAPLTDDFNSLKYLVKNMSLDYVTLKGTDLMTPLEITNELLKNSDKKALVIFTDGGDQNSFKKEIEYAKKHHIKVFVYAIATKKGGVIKTQNGVLKDKNGDIVITRLNENIKELAIKSGGAYMKYSLSNSDIKYLVDDIRSKFKAVTKNELTIKDRVEMFYYPLIFGIILFLTAIFSLPKISPRRRA